MQNRVYGPTAKAFHWLTMALLTVQYAIGWIMPNPGRQKLPESLLDLHFSFGAVVLALVLARSIWRLFHPVPPEPGLGRWQSLAAMALHLSLYALIVVTSLSGWLYVSARGWSVTVFGALPLPALVAEGSKFGHAIGETHQVLIWVLLTAIGLHVLAALVHLLVYRDRVMQRMLPRAATTGRLTGEAGSIRVRS